MKIEIEKLSPSVFLDEDGAVDCVLFERRGSLYGWFTNDLMHYYLDVGWLKTEADQETFSHNTFGIPGEFLE